MRYFILADNQDITHQGLLGLIKTLCAEHQIVSVSGRTQLQEELRNRPCSVVILDYTLFDFASAQQMLNLKESAVGSSWVLFCDELSVNFLRITLQADPTLSVVMKGDSKEDISCAIVEASLGGTFLCDFAARILHSGVPAMAIQDKLTLAEKSVLHQIALGKTTKEIACEKNLSFHTVNAHRKNIFRKLEVNNVHEAVKYAIRAGIVDLAEYYI